MQLHEGATSAPALKFGDVELRRDRGSRVENGEELNLTRRSSAAGEFAYHAGMVLSRDSCSRRVGLRLLGDSRLVDAHVRRLRVKIEDHPMTRG